MIFRFCLPRWGAGPGDEPGPERGGNHQRKSVRRGQDNDMKCYTLSEPGIVTGDGKITLGEGGRGRRLTQIPVPPGSVLEGDRVVSCPGPETTALVRIPDQSGFRGSWSLTGPITVEEAVGVLAARAADPVQDGDRLAERHPFIEQPFGGKVIAEGRCAQGIAGAAGGGAEMLVSLAPGQGFSVLRGGRLYGHTATVTYIWDGKEMKSFAPLVAARGEIAARALAEVAAGPAALNSLGSALAGIDIPVAAPRWVNLTPHVVRLNSGEEIPPIGQVARVSSTYVEETPGMYRVTYGAVVGLPAPVSGTVYIVSGMVAGAVKREDVVSPATGHPECVRREGQVWSVPGFVRG